MKIRILRKAMSHLADASRFYEQQSLGLGIYFRNCLIEDIERLHGTGGMHQIVPEGFFRSVSRRFPFAIYYLVEGGEVIVAEVLDSRRDPDWIHKQLN